MGDRRCIVITGGRIPQVLMAEIVKQAVHNVTVKQAKESYAKNSKMHKKPRVEDMIILQELLEEADLIDDNEKFEPVMSIEPSKETLADEPDYTPKEGLEGSSI